MKARTLLFIFFMVVGGARAFAQCPEPGSADFRAVATALFDCSSTLPHQGGETERKFQIHYDFPQALPNASTLPWMAVDPMTDPAGYLQAILGYATKVNARDDVDWRIEDNKTESWCSAPWFHMLREPLHGMTSERWSRPKELHELQGEWARNWAVGIYNDVACYGFGQIWKDPAFPKTKGFSFADGALAVKMLFTNATPSQVPYLTGSKEWNVAAGDGGSIVTMRLLQLDVSTKDKRSPNGWFFGTFMYDATQPGDTVWERLVPVGLIWGSDNGLTASAYLEKAAVPNQSWVNPAVASRFFALPRHNLGLFGRANGPVDNPKADCISCHLRALDWGRAVLKGSPEEKEALTLLPDVPNDPFNDAAVKAYFRDIGSQSPVPNTQSLDYSLQVSEGVAAFRTWVATAFPDHAESTTDVTPYPFTPAPPAAAAAAPADIDEFKIGTEDMNNDLFVR